MDNAAKTTLREFLRECLETAGDRHEFADDSSLFISGRLDSLSMTHLVVFLEDTFQIDFGRVDFDVEMIDTLKDIEAFVDNELARAGQACS